MLATSAVLESGTQNEHLARAVRERYRCPHDFLRFQLRGELSSKPGFFRFGPDAIAYGRTSLGGLRNSPDAELYDAAADCTAADGVVSLSFDPNEAIDNLRLERYLDRGARFKRLLKSLYYGLRPLTNRSLRSHIQKFHARDWQSLSFPHWPVDTSVENLCEALLLRSIQAAREPVPFIWFWPRGHQGCVLMTHDVETDAGRDFCQQVLAINAAFGIKASFQVVPEDRYQVPPEYLGMLRARGAEIVVQDLNHDGRLYDEHREFLRRAEKIRHYAREYGADGFRAAVLYRRPEWLNALGFAFDMSMPNVAHLDPQRGGCCSVFPYWIGDVVELPVTTAQDYTLFHLLHQYTIDLWKEQVGRILEKNGMASFIIHPDYITEPAQRAVYEQLAAWLQLEADQHNLWIALPGEINRWWRRRSQMSLIRAGSSWRIEGEGAEQAVLAYALEEGGKLVYELAADASDAPRDQVLPRPKHGQNPEKH